MRLSIVEGGVIGSPGSDSAHGEMSKKKKKTFLVKYDFCLI